MKATRHISHKLFIIKKLNFDMPIYIKQKKRRKLQMPRAEFEPTNPDLMETVLATELPRQPLWSDSNITLHVDSKETSIARHLLQGLSDWELLLQTVETCSSDQMKVSQQKVSNKLFIIGEVNSQSHYIRPVKSAGSPYLTITFWECFSTGSSFK